MLCELWSQWAPQMVTALGRVAGQSVGIVANQPRSLAGTLDIFASQKAARFVRFCDSFNLPIVTFVDTPGFLPGKDLEWRGMIRHGAELAFAYAEATVPRICFILRKAFGGAYIVMDSKGLGNDLCLAWPGAEVAVMGARGAVQVLHRRTSPVGRTRLEAEYTDRYLTPWPASERGLRRRCDRSGGHPGRPLPGAGCPVVEEGVPGHAQARCWAIVMIARWRPTVGDSSDLGNLGPSWNRNVPEV